MISRGLFISWKVLVVGNLSRVVLFVVFMLGKFKFMVVGLFIFWGGVVVILIGFLFLEEEVDV